MRRTAEVPERGQATIADVGRTVRLAPEARAAALMAAARQLLHEVGYENFLPSELARRCAVSEGLIYRYFPTKRDLLSRITVEWFGEVLAVELELEQIRSADERLRHVLARGLELVRKEPELARYMFWELRSARDDYSSNSYALTRRYADIVERVLYDAVAAGEFRDDVDVRLVRDMVFGAMEHWTSVLMRGGTELDVHVAADQIAAVVQRGMSVGPTQRCGPSSPSEVIHVCNHVPRCPAATASARLAARIRAPHPEQGWNLLCNGVVVFEDGGVLLPDGAAITPPSSHAA